MRLSFAENAVVIALILIGGCSPGSSPSIDRSVVDAEYQSAVKCAALLSDASKGYQSSRPDVVRRLEDPYALAVGRAQGIGVVLGFSGKQRDQPFTDIEKAANSDDIKSAAFDLVNAKGPTDEDKVVKRICGRD